VGTWARGRIGENRQSPRVHGDIGDIGEIGMTIPIALNVFERNPEPEPESE